MFIAKSLGNVSRDKKQLNELLIYLIGCDGGLITFIISLFLNSSNLKAVLV